MKTDTKYTITSALPYANGPLHIGHIAGAYLPADIFVRYLRMRGADVVYICGSDEHGAAITIQAKKEGITPKDIINKYHQLNKQTFEQFQISFDIYHRTSSEIHHQTSAEFFKTLYDKGVFIEQVSEQYYDEQYHQFLADRYITGACPKCSNENAYGDQCENCGSTLSPTELINPKSTLSGEKPILKTTKHWYLPLDKDTEWLKEWVNEGTLEGKQHHNPKEWKKNVLGQCNGWLNDGLRPRAITRDLDWGVPVPLKDAEGKVLYVWLDAPIGYISATKQWALDNGKNWKDYWQNPNAKLYHFIGKDNIVFHTVIFPAILKYHGDYVLPENVPANEFMNLEGDKMSTSRNWSVKLDEYLQKHPTKIDELRYVLAVNLPETKDSEFTWKNYQTLINNELVANFGNFVNRVLVLIHKYYEGEVPAIDHSQKINNGLTKGAQATIDEIFDAITNKVQQYVALIEQFKFRDALAQLMDISAYGNSFLQFNEPWKLIKTEPEKVKMIMGVALNITATLAALCEPYLPITSKKIKQILNDDALCFDFENVKSTITKLTKAGQKINQPSILFEKIEDEFVAQELVALKANIANDENESKASNSKPEIVFDDFAKLDFRVGTITAAEKIAKADKLLKLEVDMGFETRTVVSGIAQHFKPEDVIGQQVIVVANLAPRKLRGIQSKGMILMAEDANGKLVFQAPATKVENGSAVN